MNDENEDEVRLIQDLEHYIRSHGLIDSSGPTLDTVEALQRQREEFEFQHKTHDSIFGVEDDDTFDHEREKILQRCAHQTIALKTSTAIIRDLPLLPLASSCDTVYTMIRSRRFFDGNMTQQETVLSLEQFHDSPVREFLDIVLSHKPIETISSHHIVECCRISHFLQCLRVLEPVVVIIESSIDRHNCASICQLADQLDLSSLFTSALSCMIGSLDEIQDHELWEEFPNELRRKVVTMRNAVQSSILARGKKCKIFFTSSEEFLAIFAENIREQKERLREAQSRQAEIIEERRTKGGRHCDLMGGSVRDAAIKIEKQEARIQTLDAFYREQTIIFSNGIVGDGDMLDGSFSL